ncbi:MAG TPA: hypothetical protein PLU53_11585 [Bacteroidia bacterium]|nr:hypothetical protein [Bacteroidia bacterium]
MKTKLKLHLMVMYTVLVSYLSIQDVKAQAFVEGNNSINVGYGFGTVVGTLFNSYKDYNEYSFSTLGPLFLKYEHAVNDKIGIGLNVAYAKWELSYRYNGYSNQEFTEKDSYTTYSILGRFNLHFGHMDKFDPYWGFGLGFRNANLKFSSSDPNGPKDTDISNPIPIPLGFETTIGARYYFSDNFGIYAEAGFAKAVTQAGLTFRF